MARCFFHAKKELSDVPNEENLKPVQNESEARALGKKGGVKSGEARRKKKALRESMEALLVATLKDDELIKKFAKFGFKKGMTMQEAIAAAMINQAAKGNVKAYVAIKDTVEPKDGEAEQNDEARHITVEFV